MDELKLAVLDLLAGGITPAQIRSIVDETIRIDADVDEELDKALSGASMQSSMVH
jgi:capsular polysaccharide biosynthesis protein